MSAPPRCWETCWHHSQHPATQEWRPNKNRSKPSVQSNTLLMFFAHIDFPSNEHKKYYDYFTLFPLIVSHDLAHEDPSCQFHKSRNDPGFCPSSWDQPGLHGQGKQPGIWAIGFWGLGFKNYRVVLYTSRASKPKLYVALP